MWIQEFRKKNELSVHQFGNLVRRRCERAKLTGRISDGLIENLECIRGYVTHPRFANVIAEVCGATAEQRDSIVAEKRRGKWKPGRRGAAAEAELERARANPWRTLPAVKPAQPAKEKSLPVEDPDAEHQGGVPKKPVLQIDRSGKVLARFDSAREAARGTGLSAPAIAARCMRRLRGDEFARYGYTFRWGEEGTGNRQ